MSGVIGQAFDFYRLRLARLDEVEGLDFEWHDDILYREPPPARVRETETWIVQAVELDSEETLHEIARYASRAEAQDVLAQAEEALAELTRSQFEERFFADIGPPQGT